MASFNGLSEAAHCPLDGMNAGLTASRLRNAISGFSFVIIGGRDESIWLGVSEMLAIQTSRTRLAPVPSASLDNRQNYDVPDKYSLPGQLFDHIYFTNQKN